MEVCIGSLNKYIRLWLYWPLAYYTNAERNDCDGAFYGQLTVIHRNTLFVIGSVNERAADEVLEEFGKHTETRITHSRHSTGRQQVGSGRTRGDRPLRSLHSVENARHAYMDTSRTPEWNESQYTDDYTSALQTVNAEHHCLHRTSTSVDDAHRGQHTSSYESGLIVVSNGQCTCSVYGQSSDNWLWIMNYANLICLCKVSLRNTWFVLTAVRRLEGVHVKSCSQS